MKKNLRGFALGNLERNSEVEKTIQYQTVNVTLAAGENREIEVSGYTVYVVAGTAPPGVQDLFLALGEQGDEGRLDIGDFIQTQGFRKLRLRNSHATLSRTVSLKVGCLPGVFWINLYDSSGNRPVP